MDGSTGALRALDGQDGSVNRKPLPAAAFVGNRTVSRPRSVILAAFARMRPHRFAGGVRVLAPVIPATVSSVLAQLRAGVK